MSIFKACDIRGVYPDELDEATAEAIGLAIGAGLPREECILGGDLRPSTPALKDALCRGLLTAGVNVVDVGTVPTPVAYWAKRRLGTAGAVMVTASHNPPEYNGVKFMIGSMPVTPEDVDAVRQRVKSPSPRAAATGPPPGRSRRRDVRGEYLGWLAQRFAESGDGQRALIDAGNGSASEWAPEAFRAAGYEIEELFCEPDGRFPNRSPNPTAPGALESAAQRVRETGADFAVCFDGDADRAVFLDESGDYVPAEDVLILLARQALRGEPGAAVVYDQKSTRMVPREIERAGGRPVMERSGHSFLKRRLIEEDAVLGGEASGHFFFRELQGDDGIYAALRGGELLASSGRPFSELRRTIPPYYISEDIRIARPRGDAQAVVERVGEAFADHAQDHTDGVRIEFEAGWALCRPSVTEPAVTLRVEGDTPKDLEEISQRVLDAIGAIIGK
ncbi:MAG: phosphomannomutase/phosphoglucomutase [Phycisphaerae bacterium]|nr:phosphomannomutase/phosphoglucomutase [Phycisphaerae bacterium]